MLPNFVAARCNRRIVLVFAILATPLVLLSTIFTLQDDAYGRRAANIVHQAVDAVEQATKPYRVTPGTTDTTTTTASEPIVLSDLDEYCRTFPDPGNIAVILKTGATEIHEKVPMQLATSLRCVKWPIILSDLEQHLGNMKVHDVLSNVSEEAMKNNTDFNIYRLQREYLANGRENELSTLRDLPGNSTDWHTEGKSAAWELDKYKFLHMIESSWELAPKKDWYVFVEADTYLSWPNLLYWLSTLDHEKPLYFGNGIRMWEYKATELLFGHGGSGILLSGATVAEFAATNRDIARKWDERIREMWFGDFVLAAALYEELDIRITKAQPSMTGNEPETQAFLPEMWCQPVITVHHIANQPMNAIWQYEKQHNDSGLRWKDVYHVSFPQGMPNHRNDWDNIAGDEAYALDFSPAQGENQSYESCELACSHNPKCMQFMYTESWTKKEEGPEVEKKCHHSLAIILGNQRLPRIGADGPDSLQTWSSGWMKDRIAKWVEDHRDCVLSDSNWPT
ncbi:glycosyltransferase family 31 [Lecanosticta acicola]|uniref:N-acetylgalactosaminide beta-1,3-galactosyltransferase n=1 Tax=Lecanosticta acicola TaxID=111012 RepID=A0AAI9E8D0_9PEZI|nr:glycosyltransferase family 31 [Lecanosticta acicola]